MGSVKLTDEHRKVLTAWTDCYEEEGYLSFAAIAKRSETDPRRTRRVVRHLARKGLTVFGKGLWTDDGSPAGSGYALTRLGLATLTSPTSPGAQEDRSDG